MGTLCISEFQDWPIVGIPVAEQSIELGDKPVLSRPFLPTTKAIRLSSDAPFGMSFNGDADPRKHRVPADTQADYQVGLARTVSVVAAPGAQNASELDALIAYSQAIRAAARMTDPDWLDGRIAELAAATDAHKQAKEAAEAALQNANAAQTLARSAQAAAEDLRASFKPQEDDITRRAAQVEAMQKELDDHLAQAKATREALTVDRAKLEADRQAISDEVDRRIAGMKTDYETKMRDLGDLVAKVKAREDAVTVRETALKAAQDEHAAVVADMQRLSQRFGVNPVIQSNN